MSSAVNQIIAEAAAAETAASAAAVTRERLTAELAAATEEAVRAELRAGAARSRVAELETYAQAALNMARAACAAELTPTPSASPAAAAEEEEPPADAPGEALNMARAACAAELTLIDGTIYAIKAGNVYAYDECSEWVGAFVGRLTKDGTIVRPPPPPAPLLRQKARTYAP